MNPHRSQEFFSGQPPAEDTFDGVLSVVFADFMKGDFEMIRTFLRTSRDFTPLCTFLELSIPPDAVNEINPNLNLRDDTIESVIETFRRLRSIVLSEWTTLLQTPLVTRRYRRSNICPRCT